MQGYQTGSQAIVIFLDTKRDDELFTTKNMELAMCSATVADGIPIPITHTTMNISITTAPHLGMHRASAIVASADPETSKRMGITYTSTAEEFWEEHKDQKVF